MAASLDSREHALQDFLFLRHFSYGCKQVFSADRWALTGEAGLFLDPFYSPGSDFIAISNTYICDLIERDRAGQPVAPHAEIYQQLYFSFYENTLTLYQDQYPLFGDAAGDAGQDDLGLHLLLGAAGAAVLRQAGSPTSRLLGPAARAFARRPARSTSACRRCCATGAQRNAARCARMDACSTSTRIDWFHELNRALHRRARRRRASLRASAPMSRACNGWPARSWRRRAGRIRGSTDHGLDPLLADARRRQAASLDAALVRGRLIPAREIAPCRTRRCCCSWW